MESLLPKQRYLWIYAILAALSVVYLYLVFTVPSGTSARYGMTSTVVARIGPPLMVIAWFIGMYAALSLLAVARSLKEESHNYRNLAIGIFFMIAGTAATFMMRASSAHLLHTNMSRAVAILAVSNSVSVLSQSVGFFFMFTGSRGLLGRKRPEKSAMAAKVLLGVAMAIFASAVVWSIFTNPTRTIATPPQLPTYFLPDAGIFALIVLPFLVACTFDLLAACNLIDTYRAAAGTVHKKTTSLFTTGMLLQFLGWILLQAYLSIGSARLTSLGLGVAVLATVPFALLILTGFAFVGRAAKYLGAVETFFSKYESKQDDEFPKIFNRANRVNETNPFQH